MYVYLYSVFDKKLLSCTYFVLQWWNKLEEIDVNFSFDHFFVQTFFEFKSCYTRIVISNVTYVIKFLDQVHHIWVIVGKRFSDFDKSIFVNFSIFELCGKKIKLISDLSKIIIINAYDSNFLVEASDHAKSLMSFWISPSH